MHTSGHKCNPDCKTYIYYFYRVVLTYAKNFTSEILQGKFVTKFLVNIISPTKLVNVIKFHG